MDALAVAGAHVGTVMLHALGLAAPAGDGAGDVNPPADVIVPTGPLIAPPRAAAAAAPTAAPGLSSCPSSTAALAVPWRPLLLLAALVVAFLAQLLLNPSERWRMRRVPGFAWRPLFGSLPLLARLGTHEFFLEGERRFAAGNTEAGSDSSSGTSSSSSPTTSSSTTTTTTPTTPSTSSTPSTSRPALWKAWFGPRPWLVITDAEVARRACGRVSARPPLSAIGPTRLDRAYPGLFMARGAHFHALKRAWQPAFAPASLERYGPLMERAAEDLVARLRQEAAAAAEGAAAEAAAAATGATATGNGNNNEPQPALPPPTNLYQAIGDLSMAVVGSCAFGVDFATIATGGGAAAAAARGGLGGGGSSGSSSSSSSSGRASSSSEEGDDLELSSETLDEQLPPAALRSQHLSTGSFSWPSEGRELVRAAAATFAATAGIRTSPWGVAAAVVPWAAPLIRELADRWPDEGLARMQESRRALSRAAMRLIDETRRKKLLQQQQQEEERLRSPSRSPSPPPPLPSPPSSLAAPAMMKTGIAPGSFLAQLMAFNDVRGCPPASSSAASSPRAARGRSDSPASPFSRGARARAAPAAAAAAARNAAAAAAPTTLADASLVSQAQTFMLGGFDTTTIALSMATALLAKHPDKAARLRAEIDAADAAAALAAAAAAAAAADSPDGAAAPPPPPPMMPYAAAVIDEALRLHPPGSILLRDPSALPPGAPPLVLPLRTDGHGAADPAAGTLRVPRTARVFANLYAIHRDPRYWPRADEFLPERFLAPEHGGDPSVLGPSTPAAYMPFGCGARACPGAKFALREARTVLVALHRAFEFELASDEPMRLVAGLTLSPADGVWVRLRERKRPGGGAADGSPAAPAAPEQPPTPTPSTPTRLA